MKRSYRRSLALLAGAVIFGLSANAAAQDDPPHYLQDSGTGVPLSMFGTYIEPGLGDVEGTQDELELINDLQFRISSNAFIRINNAFGVTSKATDWAPEVGVLFHF